MHDEVEERRAPYDPMPHGPAEVGVGPWEGAWPEAVGTPGSPYDTALLAIAYVEAWRATGDPAFAEVARGVLRYVADDMTSPEGVFYAATDADSPVPGADRREEGWSFTWTPDELDAALDPEQARAVAAWYGVTVTRGAGRWARGGPRARRPRCHQGGRRRVAPQGRRPPAPQPR